MNIPRQNRGGDCFEAAAKYVMDEDSDAILVHGEVTGQGPIAGLKFGHAWAEKNGMVIDKSNGKDLELPEQLYYALGQVSKTFKYTAKEMFKKIAKFKTWGPWDLRTKY